MEAPSDAGALQRLRGPVLGATGHEAGHLVLGNHQLLAAPLGQLDIGCGGGEMRKLRYYFSGENSTKKRDNLDNHLLQSG